MSDFLHDNGGTGFSVVNEQFRYDGICQIECRDASCETPERRGFRPALRWVVEHHHRWQCPIQI